MNREELYSYLTITFPQSKIDNVGDFTTMHVNKDDILQVAKQLKENAITAFDFLFCQTAVDWITRFEVVYNLTSTEFKHSLVLKVVLEDRDHAQIDSVVSLWKAAELYECEIYDLFGIRFNGHPTLRRIFLGDDWLGFPLRKDYKDEVNIVKM
jgi:NADH/F420H2 dehydrogenase subunit C